MNIAGGQGSGRQLGQQVAGHRGELILQGKQFLEQFTGPGDQRIDECIYVNRPLTSTEIAALYNGGVPRNPHRVGLGADLKSWWRFGDSRDTGSTIFDEIGSNNLTTVNMDASNYGTP